MPTIHYTKKQFIEQMEKFIGDDEHILLTTEVEGSIELLNKGKLKQVPFIFASDAFAVENSVHDLLETKMLAVVIAKNELVAKQFKTKKNANTKKG